MTAAPRCASALPARRVGDAAARDPAQGIIVNWGAVIELHGFVHGPVWTRLSATADKGASSLTLKEPVDWPVGGPVAEPVLG